MLHLSYMPEVDYKGEKNVLREKVNEVTSFESLTSRFEASFLLAGSVLVAESDLTTGAFFFDSLCAGGFLLVLDCEELFEEVERGRIGPCFASGFRSAVACLEFERLLTTGGSAKNITINRNS